MEYATSSAPGKLFLFGEHAVMYGEPAIAFAVDKRIHVFIKKTKKGIKINNEKNLKKYPHIFTALKEILKKAKYKGGLDIKTKSEIPFSGLGSSGATLVATIACLSKLFNLKLTKKQIYETAFKAKLKREKTGSGVDVGVSTFGGVIFYHNKKIKKIKHPNLKFMVVHTGKKGNTKVMINKLKRLKERYKAISKLIKENGKISILGKKFLEKNKIRELGKLMYTNHTLLDVYGANTKELNDIVFTAAKNKALGAKTSGAGGGDCAIILPGKQTKISSFKKYKKIITKISRTGVK